MLGSVHRNASQKNKKNYVGGFNPSEKYYCSQIGSFPQKGVKKQIVKTTT